MRFRPWNVVFLVVATAACGRIGFEGEEQDGAAGDASLDGGRRDGSRDGTVSDGSMDASAGDHCEGEWGAPTVIDSLAVTEGRDDDPSMTGDLLELYFASQRPGGVASTNLWRSTRASADSPWGAPTIVENIGVVNTPHISSDGLSLWISKNVGGGDEDIFVATRKTRDDPWGVPVAVDELNTVGYDDKSAVPYADSLRIVFTSDRPAGEGELDIYRARRTNLTSPWTDIERLATVSTMAFESTPSPIQSGLRIYFHSNRTGAMKLDLFVASFSQETLEYDEALRIDRLSSAEDDEDIAVSDDECYAVFSSNRSGVSVLYEAHRAR